MRLFFRKPVRRLIGLVALLFVAIPFGISVSGCKKALPLTFCDAGDSGPVEGQIASITLSPTLATVGESLSYAQIGQTLSATAFDCKNNTVATSKFVYGTTNMALADINPSTGAVCAGTWNRNTGGGIADFTTCTAPSPLPTLTNNGAPVAFVTASANGATSNSIPIFIHPTVTSVVLGNPTPGAPASCSTVSDPGSDCCPTGTTTVYNPVPPPYFQNSCVSQNSTAQLIARVYANGSNTPANNITCQVGHLTFSSPTAPNIVQIDQNGVATANQPGSTLISASVSSSSSASSAGFFSTCPPASITLSLPNSSATSATVNINNSQPLTATVRDMNNTVLTGISLEIESTTPQTAPGGTSTITPIFPGTADITAICQPASCNPSPFSQLGYLGNGKPVQSNSVTINTPGTSSTEIYLGSTQSQYVLPVDFSTGLQSAPVKLPYVPNSMVISLDGSILYVGSAQGLMTITASNNSVGGPNLTVPGTVLSISPDGSTVVITDPTRQTISLYSTGSSSVTSVTGGIGTHAVWSPDSQIVYVTTTTNALLNHTTFTDWQTTTASEPYTDAVVMVPSIGAYFAGGTPGVTGGVTTDGRSYCPSTTLASPGTPPTEANTFAPLANINTAITDRLAVTNIGQHILGAHAMPAGSSTFTDLQFTFPTQTANGIVTPQACPIPPATVSTTYFSSTQTTLPIAGTPAITAATITGVFPTSGQVAPLNNEVTFVTYTGTGAQLPEYVLPSGSTTGSLTYVPLSGTATAPISGVWSTDNLTFYTGTSGDNLVHEITQSCTTTTPVTCTWKDSGQLTPSLPAASGTGTAPVNLITQRPKRVTS